jgi:hypothetical protein
VVVALVLREPLVALTAVLVGLALLPVLLERV